MLSDILCHFPVHTHPLILVSDPDGLLSDESALAALIARGFRIVAETDAVALRSRWCQALPATVDAPVIVVTPHPLDQLPYDLWQQGHHVNLALHEFFPNLDYPTLRQLSPAQRSKLAEARERADWPDHPLSPRQTADFLLDVVFDARPAVLNRPGPLLLWLARYHAANSPMAQTLADRLLAELQQSAHKSSEALVDWPLADLLANPDAFRSFVQDAWGGFVGQMIGEAGIEYAVRPSSVRLRFGEDPELQDALSALVRTGTLEPVSVDKSIALPSWARVATAQDEESVRLRQIEEGLEALRDQLAPDELQWEAWQAIARWWALLTLWRHGANAPRLPGKLFDGLHAMESLLDERFAAWLSARYTSLATRPLPLPHHLFQAPTWMEHCFHPQRRIALLVLDGMAVADWLLIRGKWQARHPAWAFDEQLVLAEIPCVTAVSRQALTSGRRPAEFADTLTHSDAEPQRWTAFWHRAGLPADAVGHAQVPDRGTEPYPAVVDSRRMQALCLVCPVIDNMVHGATQGTSDILSSVQIWLRDSQRMEGLIDALLTNGFLVILVSDHGHAAARGMGQPQEGVLVESRGKRARLYNNATFAQAVHAQYPQTILWHDDDLLPAGWWALMPPDRRAFVTEGARVVSHGGLTIEEMVVPLVTIT